MIYAVLPLTSPHVSEAYFNKRYVVLVIPRKSAHCWPKHTFLELCFAKKPGACQTRKMLLLVPERKLCVCGYKVTCLHGKKCGGNWPNNGVLLPEEGSHFDESCGPEDRGFRGPNFLQLMTDLPAYLQQASWGGSSAFLIFVISSRWSKLYFSLFWIWYCRSIFGPANFSLKQFSGYKCVMITVVTFVIHLH